ncbi:SseB family protein [Streptomyces sp. NPDC047999]|uniref:SseB family protein n=1 Tax=Streptomyces sp. NPDC047999 TaxID=3365497 RepID=UPI0037229735
MIDNGDKTSRLTSKLADLDRPGASSSNKQTSASPLTALTLAQRRFAQLIEGFRSTAVLVPFDDQESLWTATLGGVRWICAFTDEERLARFAHAQGDASREWTYQVILGEQLLDSMVPLLPGPAGVALDVGSDNGMVFPPVRGIVPDAVAVDTEEARNERE